MASQDEDAHQGANADGKSQKPKDAFSQLMASKGKPTPKPWHRGGAFRGIADAGFRKFQSREALGIYIDNPGAFMGTKPLGAVSANADSALTVAGQVISYDDHFVSVHDKFPKASVHCLLLPRDPDLYKEHPVVLLSRRDAAGEAFRQAVRAEAEKLKAIVAGELRRRFGQFSAADAAREAVLRGDVEPGGPGGPNGPEGGLPAGRDWGKEVVMGVHARPSMSHVHVHVLSRDMHSEKLRHRKHYNSFTTPFLVQLHEFPLAVSDPRRPFLERQQIRLSSETADDAGDTAGEGEKDGIGSDGEGDGDGGGRHLSYLQWDMKCWRCGKNFGNRFQELKRHLDVEFEAWKKE